MLRRARVLTWVQREISDPSGPSPKRVKGYRCRAHGRKGSRPAPAHQVLPKTSAPIPAISSEAS
eukprot:4277869-Pyramimonas_sp.AAC.1